MDVDMSSTATTKSYNIFTISEVSIHHRSKQNEKKKKGKKIIGLNSAQNNSVLKMLIDFVVSLDSLYKHMVLH